MIGIVERIRAWKKRYLQRRGMSINQYNEEKTSYGGPRGTKSGLPPCCRMLNQQNPDRKYTGRR